MPSRMTQYENRITNSQNSVVKWFEYVVIWNFCDMYFMNGCSLPVTKTTKENLTVV